MTNSNHIKNTFIGLALGDALGVPVEFLSRSQLQKNPVVDMVGFGSHQQPAGTWSDDSSLTFCLAEILFTKGYDLFEIANNFLNWYEKAHWTAHNKVFDVGIATARAIQRFKEQGNPNISGGNTEFDNGNGSLMRIAPMVFFLQKKDIKERFKCVKEVSSITHAHIRSVMACFIFVEYMICLLEELENPNFDKKQSKFTAFQKMQKTVNAFFEENDTYSQVELRNFYRILETKNLLEYVEYEIRSSGYVLHTLEASIWCFLKNDNYKDAVLQAINLGEDTDTTGCVTGALAGLYYGLDEIPNHWIEGIARREDIIELSHKVSGVRYQ